MSFHPLPFGKGKEGKGLRRAQIPLPYPLPTGEGDKSFYTYRSGPISKLHLKLESAKSKSHLVFTLQLLRTTQSKWKEIRGQPKTLIAFPRIVFNYVGRRVYKPDRQLARPSWVSANAWIDFLECNLDCQFSVATQS